MTPPVRTKADVLGRIARLEPEIARHGVRRLMLFGSFARDAATPASDVDLLVEFAPGAKRLDAFLALAALLEEVLGRRVELVTIESLSPHLAPTILREAEHVVRAA